MYLSEADALNAKLDAATATIEAINMEEEAFEWEITQYPLRHKAGTALGPYLSLYQTAVSYHKQVEAWMNGAFDTIDPEVVESEVDNSWRALYKIEKTFVGADKPQGLAAGVKVKADPYAALLSAAFAHVVSTTRHKWTSSKRILAWCKRYATLACASGTGTRLARSWALI